MLRISTPVLYLRRRPLSGPLNVVVPAGQIHLLRGPNGCGKSLLFDVVTGIRRDSTVRVSVGQRDLSLAGAHARWTAGLRRMFQSPRMASELTPRTVLDFALRNRSRAASPDSDLSWLSQAGIRPDLPLRQHSFGQRRIVELIVALKAEHVCLLDEPFAGIRPELASELIKMIRMAAEFGKAILIIDHTAAQWTDLYDEAVDWPLASAGAIWSDTSPEIFTRNASTSSTNPRVGWSIRSFTIGDRTLARNLHLYLDSGRAIILRGANGSGKSTLLRALAGVRQPHPTARIDIEPLNQAQMLLSPQPPKLAQELTAEDSLRLMIGGGDAVPGSVLAEARALLEWLGVDPTRLRSPAEVLSGGEEGAIALVGAVLSRADLMLLDEPFESLAPKTLARAGRLLEAALKRGKMLIAATHRSEVDTALAGGHVLDLSSSSILFGNWPPVSTHPAQA